MNSGSLILLKKLVENKSFYIKNQLLLLNTTKHVLTNRRDLNMIYPIDIKTGKWKVVYSPSQLFFYHEKDTRNYLKFLINYYQNDTSIELPYTSNGMFNFGLIHNEVPKLHQIPLQEGSYTLTLNRDKSMMFIQPKHEGNPQYNGVYCE